MENYNTISSDDGQDKQNDNLWRITILSAVILDKINMNNILYGGLLFQFWHLMVKTV